MKNFLHTENYGGLRISLASSDRIRAWSRGVVTKPETINYRSFKPENDGLFCCRIFGPAKDYECLCGKYKGIKFRGVTCERCGVEITQSRVRRSYMGHIELAAPVLHVWFLRSLPSRVGLLLDMTMINLERVLYFDSFVVVDPGLTSLKKGQLLSEQERLDVYDEYGEDAVSIMIGAEAIQAMLASLDLYETMKSLRLTLKMSDKKTQQQRFARRLKTVQAFISSGNKPEWMVMDVLPVLPCDLRPLVQLEGGRFATSDLNELYRRVINRNNRLRRLKELEAPEIILRNEKRMLQESVDCLFDNSRRRRFSVSHNKRPLKSLSDMLKGKQGRFRQNLLGKRVDYSGRSVIVVGPTLKLHQCGLPKQIALELYKPFVYSRLVAKEVVGTLKGAKNYVDNESEHKEVWDNLVEVMREHPVILNRAPTLYRLGIQAFEPILVEGKAIHLHPLVCAAFNADFDGDQMAVHLPLSLEARMEARVLMMSTNNILHPANGEPIIIPTQDIVLGIYYLTMDGEHNFPNLKKKTQKKHIMTSLAEVERAFFAEKLTLHSPIVMMREELDDKNKLCSNIIETTAGRAFVGDLLPKHKNLPYALVNRLLTKGDISGIIGKVYKYCGEKQTVIFCDRLMNLGFRYACRSGISFGRQDMIIPKKKASLVKSSQESVSNFDAQYRDGLITKRERDNKVIDSWLRCSDKVAESMMEEISKPSKEGINSIYMMSHSGARGSVAQMKQLGGMRGLMAKPSGEIIPTPIVSNFREGLSVFEYFNSTHGARKGQVDTALKTANSGYLTRRLVDVAQDYTIVEKDCGTKDGLTLRPAVSSGEVIIPLGKRAFGRVLCEDIKDSSQGRILSGGSMVDTSASELIDESHIHEIKVRSPIFCMTNGGVCSQCYGQDIARNREANVGEAVGIISAQSIGEPGTQMTMRTFHHGGAAELEQQSSLESPASGKVYFVSVKLFKNSKDQHIVASHNAEIVVRDNKDRLIFMHKIPYGASLFVKDGQGIDSGEMLAKWEPHYRPLLAGISGVVSAEDFKSGISFRKTSEIGGVILDWRSSTSEDLKPALVVQSQDHQEKEQSKREESANLIRHIMVPDAQFHVKEGQKVFEGDLIASFPVVGAKTMDITGGVPRVVELFENRTPKERAFLSPIRGRVEYAEDFRGKKRIIVKSLEEETPDQEYLFSKEQQLSVQNGDIVEKGGYLVNGSPTLQDMLTVMGEEATALYLIEEIQNVYRSQGVSINDRHIEVIIRRMLCRVTVVNSGDSDYIEQDEINREEFLETQERLKSEKKKPPVGTLKILGITRAALQTQSFISAASFQETVRVLTEAAIQGKVDPLRGLKENVIVGRLIPAGTGSVMRKFQEKVLNQIEQERIEQEQQEEQKALATSASEGAHSEGAHPEEPHPEGEKQPEVDSPETASPEMDAPETDAPETDAPDKQPDIL